MAKKKKNTKASEVFTDVPYTYKPYRIGMAVIAVLWFLYVSWTGYWGIVHHSFPVIDSGLQIAILWWFLDTLLTRTTYRLEDDALLMVKRGVGHKQIIRIPYSDIFGVHHFKNQLMRPMSYRYTFHQYSRLDNRPIWCLLYDIGSAKKAGRILMKGSEPFWRAFAKKMPGQIRIPQEEVVNYAYHAFSEKMHGNAGQEMSMEEGLEQLRQKGTEMGGAEDEVTAADFKDLDEVDVGKSQKKQNAERSTQDGKGSR